MQIIKFLFNKPQFYCWTDIFEICDLNLVLWSFQLIYCVFHKGLPPSYHRKSICLKDLSYCLKSTLLPSDNSVGQSFLCCNFKPKLLKLVPLFVNSILFLVYYIPYCKVKSTFHGCNYSIFDRVRRKCSMFRNAIASIRQSRFC